MKILLIGAHGTLGKILYDHLSLEHQIVSAARSAGDIRIDISDINSIKNAFESIDNIDAIVNVAGHVKWADFSDLSTDDFHVGLNSKLMGQVNLVRMAQIYFPRLSSITLISGILAEDPVYMSTSASMVNGALHSFVLAAHRELKHCRLNVVAPGLLKESEQKLKHLFPGHTAIESQRMIKAFERSLFGRANGEIIRVY